MEFSFREALPVVAALAGAVVGGLVAELRTLLQGARERRRARRVLLYQLLELRFRVATREPRLLLSMLVVYLERRLGPEIKKMLNSPDVQPLLRRAFEAAAALSLDPPIDAQYEQAVDALAPYDPILAYRLRNQNQLLNLERELRRYYEKVLQLPEVSADPQAAVVLPQVESAGVDAARSNSLKELASNIRGVARWIGPSTYYRAVRILRRQDKPSVREVEKVLDGFIAEVIARLGKASAA